MGKIKGPDGTSGAQHAACNPEDGIATVRKDEKTIEDVAKRLKVDPGDLLKANPHLGNSKNLQAGMDICMPKKTDSAQPSNSKPREILPEDKNKKEGFKMPEGKVGGYKVPVPIPKRESDDTYEWGTNRKDEQNRLDNARRQDDRDLHPNVIADEKKRKIEESAKHVDRGRYDPEKVAREKELIKQLGDKLRVPK